MVVPKILPSAKSIALKYTSSAQKVNKIRKAIDFAQLQASRLLADIHLKSR